MCFVSWVALCLFEELLVRTQWLYKVMGICQFFFWYFLVVEVFLVLDFVGFWKGSLEKFRDSFFKRQFFEIVFYDEVTKIYGISRVSRKWVFVYLFMVKIFFLRGQSCFVFFMGFFLYVKDLEFGLFVEMRLRCYSDFQFNYGYFLRFGSSWVYLLQCGFGSFCWLGCFIFLSYFFRLVKLDKGSCFQFGYCIFLFQQFLCVLKVVLLFFVLVFVGWI